MVYYQRIGEWLFVNYFSYNRPCLEGGVERRTLVMRHIFVLVFATFVLAFSASAQNDQVIGNDGPEVFNTSAMPEESSVSALRTQPRTQPLTFVPAPPRRTVHPAETGGLRPAIHIECMGPTVHRDCYVTYSVLGSVHSEVRVDKWLERPDGVVVRIGSGTSVFNPGGQNWWGQLLFGPFPAENLEGYPDGIYTVRVTILAEGKVITVTGQVSHRISKIPILGPLEGADPVAGGINLSGKFGLNLVVIASQAMGNIPVPMQGDYFIPSNDKLEGSVVFTVSAEKTPDNWESSTRTVCIPTVSAAPRER
ncbi:MAG: hypothetical protein UT78_C0005G0017 [Candidatus Nomurabacteria bacterium GW2011_GWF2_40_12]|uniref:Uncharacterized protein n=1 Tax=Candidatus Nomurabacteria bacterium GW2011_GWF2_40_12 TaxID=1618776 RepID=A0A0G0QSY6_9BACT|nr:MAG: hypothetical protein UT78_C0005G0017 [Candidatus Nomurabacteria bacterium GW2011_GWF2_40_12]